MSAVDVITAAGAAVGIITGGVGVVLAVRADGRAKKASQSAETANAIAEEANRIAEEANQFAEESNAITRQQAAQQNEHWVVQWFPEWKKESALLVLRNRGSHRARRPSVVIQARGVHRVYDELGDVEVGGELTLGLPEIREQRNKKIRDNDMAGGDRSGGYFRSTLTITVAWRTGEDAFRQAVLQQNVN